MLSNPQKCHDFASAQSILRQWRAAYDMLEDLNTVLPDPTTLVTGLIQSLSHLESVDEMFKFECLSLRSSLNLMFDPSYENVEKYRLQILAEVGSRVHSEPDSSDFEAFRVNSGGNNSSSAGTKKCNFFLTDKGCAKGSDCGFGHARLTPQDSRCFNCGSKGHRNHQCKAPRKNDSGGNSDADRKSAENDRSGNGRRSENNGDDALKELIGEIKALRNDLKKKVKIEGPKN